MSYTSIPPKIRWQVWLKAGGRCEYHGCNEPLWKDNLTLTKMNRAYLAHIVADSPNGPRGDAILSEKLKADPSNIMLLCDTHHRLIDKEKVDEHSPELLRRYKQDHEDRIERLTAVSANLRTEILLFGTRIGEHQGEINFEEACETILPSRYPSSDKGIRIDLSAVNLNEQDTQFWEMIQLHIDRELSRYLGDGRGPSGKPINHLSIFALAPIPALVYLGKKLGDIKSADVYQRHRQPPTWKWIELQEDDFEYIVSHPCAEEIIPDAPIVINLSLSNPVRNSDIESFFNQKVNMYSIALQQPRRDFLQAQEQLELFVNEWYSLLSQIMTTHGSNCEVHLFAAVPNSIAVEIGRSLLLKVDPHLVIYEAHNGSFKKVLTVC